MKRLLCLCLCAGLVFGTGGCGNAAEQTEQTAQQTQEQKEETTGQETQKEETKEIQEQTEEATDFFNSINDVLKYAESPTLDTWERTVDEKETIKYKYTDGEEYIEVWYSNTGIVIVSYYGDPSSDLVQMFAIPTVQSIKYFEGDNAETIADEIHLFAPVEGDSTTVGKNGKTYTFSFTTFDETHINSILMIG